MIYFITEHSNEYEPDILTTVKNHPLFLISLDGQLLGRHEAPASGWTHETLCKTNESAEPSWSFCGVETYLCEQKVGSSEV